MTREGLWLILVVVACLSPRARPLALLLTVCAAYTYAVIYGGMKSLGGYHAAVLLDLLALGVGLVILHVWGMREWWARAVVGLYVPTLLLQGLWMWLGSPEPLGLVCYWWGLGTFTAQLLLLAGAGCLELGHPTLRVDMAD